MQLSAFTKKDKPSSEGLSLPCLAGEGLSAFDTAIGQPTDQMTLERDINENR